MLILAADTSGKSLSVSICEDEKPLVETTLNLGYKHSVTFQPLIDDIIKRSGRDKLEIDLFACTDGPGSFTGIRIGVAAIKTMAWALGKPAIGISSLETLAAAFPGAIVCPVLDARGGRVFSALYKTNDKAKELLKPANRQAESLWQDIIELRLLKEQIYEICSSPVNELQSKTAVGFGTEAKFEPVLDPIVVVGDGLPVVRSALAEEFVETKVIWTTPEHWTPRASILSRLAYLKFKSGDIGDPFALMPQYHSLSQAERLRENKNQHR